MVQRLRGRRPKDQVQRKKHRENLPGEHTTLVLVTGRLFREILAGAGNPYVQHRLMWNLPTQGFEVTMVRGPPGSFLESGKKMELLLTWAKTTGSLLELTRNAAVWDNRRESKN